MNIRDKLKYIDAIGNREPSRDVKRIEKADLTNFFDGTFIETAHGPCFVMTHRYSLGVKHGTFPIELFDLDHPHALELMGKNTALREMSLQNALFFDTETTGLSSGTGTHIFLAGFGYFTDDAYEVKQFFLRDYDEEQAFLSAINNFLESYQTIISYNGKSYDWPMMQTRYVSNKMTCPMSQPPHLDLLHTSRRIWKRRLQDCSLQNIESRILGFARKDDIPGALIPQMYFSYLQDQNPEPLRQVFQHNVWDIVSLAILLQRLYAIYTDPWKHLSNNEDLLSLARALDNQKEWDACIPLYKRSMDQSNNRGEWYEAAMQLSMCCKRIGDWEQAIQLWNKMIQEKASQLEPYIELAKYYEHVQRQYDQAMEIVQKALTTIELIVQLRPQYEYTEPRDALQHRLRRIKQKASGLISPETDI